MMTYSKKMTLFSGCALALAVFSGCGGSTPSAEQALSVERLAVVGAQIYATPDGQAEILGDAGLTEAQFRDAIADITLSTDQSRRYQQAFEAELNRLGVGVAGE